MVSRISVFNSRELQGVIVAMKGLDRNLATEIRGATRRVVDPVWRGAVGDRAVTEMEQRVLGRTARVRVSDQNVTLQSAGVGRPIGGRVRPADIAHAVEFGVDRERTSNYVQGNPGGGGRHQVRRRHTQRQFAPRRRTGYVVFPAVAAVLPRIASLWVQTVVRTFYESIERR